MKEGFCRFFLVVFEIMFANKIFNDQNKKDKKVFLNMMWVIWQKNNGMSATSIATYD